MGVLEGVRCPKCGGVLIPCYKVGVGDYFKCFSCGYKTT